VQDACTPSRVGTVNMDETAISDMIVSASLFQYSSLPFAPQPGKHTVLASFALHDTRSGRVQLLSLGAGVKCLPASRLPVRGDALHDSHAEVIARRGAIRWLLEEVQRDAQAQGQSAWVCARGDGLYELRDNVHLWMYASTVPCAYDPHFHSRPSSAPHTPPPSHLPFSLT
jgi:tRNA-specific adenosine deaminase 1